MENDPMTEKLIDVMQAFFALGAWSAYNNVKQALPNKTFNDTIGHLWLDDLIKTTSNGREMLQARKTGDGSLDEFFLNGFDYLERNIEMFQKVGVWGWELEDEAKNE